MTAHPATLPTQPIVAQTMSSTIAGLEKNARKWHELALLKEDEYDLDRFASDEDPNNPMLAIIADRSQRTWSRYRNAASLSEDATKAIRDIYGALSSLRLLNERMLQKYENTDDDTVALIKNAVDDAGRSMNAQLERSRTICAAARGNEAAASELAAVAATSIDDTTHADTTTRKNKRPHLK